jgi:hypothetical protein
MWGDVEGVDVVWTSDWFGMWVVTVGAEPGSVTISVVSIVQSELAFALRRHMAM